MFSLKWHCPNHELFARKITDIVSEAGEATAPLCPPAARTAMHQDDN